MKFIVMHRTDARWEADQSPSPELIAAVGKGLGEMAKAGVLVAGEGLRASAHGVRLGFHGGKRRLTQGPFKPAEALASQFLVLRVASVDVAVDWSRRVGQVLGDAHIEVRPVTEPWDIGMTPRPKEVTAHRYMAIIKDPAAEAGTPTSAERQALFEKLLAMMREEGVLLSHVVMRPSARGSRFHRDGARFNVVDGPFTEAKELIAGFVIVDVPSKQSAVEWTLRYCAVLDADELEMRELA